MDDPEKAVVVERALLRATLPAWVEQEPFESALAAAWAGVVAGHGGRVDVLRVAHALDARWHDPLGRPANRAPTGPRAVQPGQRGGGGAA